MKHLKLTSILICILLIQSCSAQKVDSRIEVVPVSIEQEATSIWRTINDIGFFEQQGYNIRLPKDRLIDSLIVKSKKGTFGNNDYASIYNLLETKFFSKQDYVQAVKKVDDQNALITALVNTIDYKKEQWDWDFKMFDTYKIVFTLYGTGGSYDPDTGTITLLTTKEGQFMNYQNPANTIIHEITHMGMEQSIVQKYKLPHGLKERIVDTFVYLMFKEQLPEYRVQNMGDTKIDNYLKKDDDLSKLNAIVSEFVD